LTTRTTAIEQPQPARPRARVLLLWTLQIVAAAMFLFSGTLKLAGAAAMVQLFANIGIGQWFRYATGTIEVVGALLLLTPSLALVGAVALALTMVAAVATHLLLVGGSPAPAAILLLITSTIAWMRWNR
jgi:putative oxidoreductase